MAYITLTISREKLSHKEFEPDRSVVSNSNSTETISVKEYYSAAVELLALIYKEELLSISK